MLSFNKAEWKERVKKGDLPDIVKINNIIYTMDYYDMEGKILSYGNKRLYAGFHIYTKDRYETFNDAAIMYTAKGHYPIREDIVYYK